MPARPRPLPPRCSAAAEAVDRFLDALALPEGIRRSADLAETPSRVARAWLEELVDGYGVDPAEVLADGFRSDARELVVVTGIEFHSVCPHHLLPSRGVAHVGYLPGGRLVGFGQIARLVDALGHRFVLQENLARQIAQALVEHLGARGAGCVLEAEQLCLTVRGERRPSARVHSEGFAGALARAGEPRRRFLAAVARAPAARRTQTGSPRARARPRGRR